jgi:transposase
MPKKFAPEFKRDVVTVARRGDLTVAEVAADFDISVESVRRWMRQADIDDGVRDGVTTAEQPELVQLRGEKRRLEMENDVGHRRPVVEDLQHRLIALLHQVQLHQHTAASSGSAGASAHSEEGGHRRGADPRVSASYRGQCRPGTGAASQNCQAAPGATVSTMNRVRTTFVLTSAYIPAPLPNAKGPSRLPGKGL